MIDYKQIMKGIFVALMLVVTILGALAIAPNAPASPNYPSDNTILLSTEGTQVLLNVTVTDDDTSTLRVSFYQYNDSYVRTFRTLTEESKVVRSIMVYEDKVIAGGSNNNVYVYNKTTRALITTLTDATHQIISVFADDKYIYSGTGGYPITPVLRIYNITDYSLVTSIDITRGNNAIDEIYADSDYIYCAIGLGDRVNIYNRTDFSSVHNLTLANWAEGVIANDDYIFTASHDYDSALQVWNRTDFSLIQNHSSGYGASAGCQKVSLDNTYYYCANNYRRVVIYNLSSLSFNKYIYPGSSTNYAMRDIYSDGTTLVASVADENNKVNLYNVSDDFSAIADLNDDDLEGTVYAVYIDADWVYTGDTGGYLGYYSHHTHIGTNTGVSNNTATTELWRSLTQGTWYKWRVGILDDGLVTTYSPIWNFTINTLPSITTPVLIHDPLIESIDVIANTTYTDTDGVAGTVYFNWSVNDVVVRSTSIASVTDGAWVNDTLGNGNYSIGDTVDVTIWASDGLENGTTKTAGELVNRQPVVEWSIEVPTQPLYNQEFYLQVNITDPDNDTISWVNFTLGTGMTTKLGNVNGSYSGSFNTFTIWNSSNVTADTTGTWSWNIGVNDGWETIYTSPRYFDVTFFNLTIDKPNQNYGRKTNIPLNYTIDASAGYTSCTYHAVNVSNTSQILKAKTAIDCADDVNYEINITFDDYENHTLIITYNATVGGDFTANVTFLLEEDTTDPVVSITEPSGAKTSLNNVPLQATATDAYIDDSTCWYKILTSLGGSIGLDHVDLTNCSSLSTTFNLATYGNYIAYVYAEDDTGNGGNDSSAFSITYTDIPGGGSSPPPSDNKVTCDITFTPSILVIDDANPVAELIISNKETVSYTPDVSFRDIDDKPSILDYVQLSNEIGTVFADSSKQTGVRYKGFATEALIGEGELVLIDDNCKDIVIPIVMNVTISSPIAGFFEEGAVFSNLIALLTGPITPSVPWLGYWVIAVAFGALFITLLWDREWSREPVANFLVKAIAWTFGVIVSTTVVAIIIKSIFGA